MPYCPECGSEVEKDSKFCRNCGASLTEGAGNNKNEPTEGGSIGSTSLDLSENVEAALSYLLLWLSGILFLVLEKKNKFVKFHAMQSVITFLPLTIISWFLSIFGGAFWFGGIGWGFFAMIGWLFWLLTLILWLILLIKAYSGEYYKLPIAGDIAERESEKRF